MLGCNLANVVIGEEWQYESECRMFFMAKTNGHIAESSWTFCACGAHHKSVCFGDKKNDHVRNAFDGNVCNVHQGTHLLWLCTCMFYSPSGSAYNIATAGSCWRLRMGMPSQMFSRHAKTTPPATKVKTTEIRRLCALPTASNWSHTKKI